MATQKQGKTAVQFAEHSSFLSHGISSFRQMFEDVLMNPATLIVNEQLGEGNYASVNLCSWEGKTVAVKTLKSELLSSQRDFNGFLKEACLMRKLSHPAIVSFVGVSTDVKDEKSGPTLSNAKRSRQAVQEPSELMRLKSARYLTLDCTGKVDKAQDPEEDNCIPLSQMVSKVMLVQEYMSQGTLKQMVTNQMGAPFKILYSKEQGLEWLIQIAKGLRYLHNAKPKIIHRDLKLENIMLTRDVNGMVIAKIGDFGLHAILKHPTQLKTHECASDFESIDAVTLQDSFSQDECHASIKASYDLSGRTGSMMYMAPEVLRCMPYNEKADVFSFGMIMYEVLCKTLMLTFVSLQGLPEEVENYAQGVASGNRPIVPDDWPKPFSNLIRKCWAHNPDDRPSMNTVVSQLLDLRGDDWICTEGAARGCGCCTLQ